MFFIGRSLKGIGSVLADSGAVTAMIFFIIISAGLFSRFLALTGIGPKIIEWLISLQLSKLGIVIAMCVVYILLGCFLDSSAMLSLTIPVIYPVVKKMGIDPIWFAMCIIVAIHSGTITPPLGLNVYAVKGVAEADVTLEDIFRGVMPFFFLTLLVNVVVIAFPEMITYLPNLMITK
jgi:TRAP-type C4-dicarboxylate transport system permease large subunit